MRSCCEKTLGVLRQNKESLITIIEVCNAKRKCAQMLTCSTYVSRAIPSVITPSLQNCMFRSGTASCTQSVKKRFVLWTAVMMSVVLKVFIHDPLYRWALTPLGAQQRQKDDLLGPDSSPGEGAGGPQPTIAGVAPDAVGSTDTTLANADAERALLRLKQKLAGLEAGEWVAYPVSWCHCLTCQGGDMLHGGFIIIIVLVISDVYQVVTMIVTVQVKESHVV